MITKMKKVWLILASASTLLLGTSCSVDLTRLGGLDQPKTIPFFEPITINYGGQTAVLDVQLQRAYTAAVDTTVYPMESCRGNITIEAVVESNTEEKGSAWAVPLTVFPFWPIMPVDETLKYHMTTHIFCNGSLTFKAEFDESELVRAFWYGKLRSDLVNQASEAMHQRLLNRLKYELQLNRNSDLNAGLS
ncbi:MULTISPECIES: hypothetical protein [unclassified Fibrobacter]|uniref:hypothetical protein n=1 Tax=unclassified Fibrobacter TaxID=2634177 RepID=UPI000D6A859B|nr:MULTISPECIES: hypothetical protein [unclassified Fibrobacter]PWJ71806.1 hypothetical protein BGX12_10140 [Fibrobacter sp. UWR4]PZW73721.1 hypothetical protein C8E88_100240 [Fibrobacter sp. UWR1]